jgi:hypothetical protein
VLLCPFTAILATLGPAQLNTMRSYTEQMPLWYIQERLALSDQYPSGLVWTMSFQRHKAGDMAGKLDAVNNVYKVWLCGTVYVAHRIVYYLRTGEDPGTADVLHGEGNSDKDNRKELILRQRKAHNPIKRSYYRTVIKTGLSDREVIEMNVKLLES